MEPTCLSGGWHQPPLPGIPRRRMCNPVHHIESHVIATYSEGLPAEVANHITNTASIVPAIAHIGYLAARTSLHHFHFFDVIGSMRAPNRGGILQVGSDE